MDASENGFELVLDQAGYPACIAELSDPPRRLYVRGDLSVLDTPALSIIGSRRATPYGLALAEMAARAAAQSNITVVSGGAIGCDQAAGRAALKAGGRHIIVLGTGADVVYPPSAADLIKQTIDAGGAVVSLEPWGTGPRPWAFPKRNRVIAALSQALFVTEAGMPSGTFSTAEAAFALGREVLAAPGSILSPQSRGSNDLIANGACCIVDSEALEMAVSRIYGTLCFTRPAAPGVPELDSRGQRALAFLIANPLRTEELAAAMHMGSIAVMHLLGGLEASGLVERLPDGRWTASKRALHAFSSLGDNRED